MNATIQFSYKARATCLAFVLLSVHFAGCSSGGGSGPAAVAISYSPAVSGYALGFEFALAPAVSASPTVYTLLAGQLPPGVSFNTSTGTLSGRPLVAGSFDLTVQAANAEGSADAALTLHVVPPPAARFLYVVNFDDDLLSAYRLDPDSGAARDIGLAATGDEPRVVVLAPGAGHAAVGTRIDGIWLYRLDPVHGRPSAVAGTPLLLGSEVRDLAFHPAGTHLYALTTAGPTEDRIFQLEFDQGTGALTPLVPPSIAAPNGSTSLAVDPLGRGLYLSHGAALRSYTIGPGGALTSAGDRTGGTIPVDIAVAPDGSAAFAVNFGSSDLYRFPIAAGGALQIGSLAADLAGSVSLMIAMTGDGDSLYVGDGGGTVEQFSVAANGNLAALTPASVGAGPELRGLVADPSGAGAWVTRGSLNDLVALAGNPGGDLTPDLQTPVRTHGLPLGLAVAPGLAPAVMKTTHLYAVNRDDDDFNQFSILPDGTLAALVPALVPTGSRPESIAVHPFVDAVYVANATDTASAIEAFGLNTSGAASALQPFPGTTAGSAMLIGLNGDSGHAVLEASVVSVSISPSGLLTAAGGTPPAIEVTGRPARHPNGRWLYFPNGTLGAVFSYAVDLDDGSLANTGGAAADLGTLAVAVDPTGRFLYAVNDGVAVDRVRGYAIDASFGTLTELASSPFVFADQARDAIDVAVHPAGRRVYVATRDSDALAGQGSIQVFAIEVDPAAGPALGELTLQGSPTLFMGQAPNDVEIDTAGLRLYVSIEANPSSVLVYALAPNGSLSAQPIDSQGTGTHTRGIGLRGRLQ